MCVTLKKSRMKVFLAKITIALLDIFPNLWYDKYIK